MLLSWQILCQILLRVGLHTSAMYSLTWRQVKICVPCESCHPVKKIGSSHTFILCLDQLCVLKYRIFPNISLPFVPLKQSLSLGGRLIFKYNLYGIQYSCNENLHLQYWGSTYIRGRLITGKIRYLVLKSPKIIYFVLIGHIMTSGISKLIF